MERVVEVIHKPYGVKIEVVKNENSSKSWIEKIYRCGKLESVVPFTRGIINGIVKSFFDNLYVETPYVNGKREGVSKAFDENGRLFSKKTYINDYKEGKEFFFYANGSVKMEIDYKRDVKNGVEREFHENGEIKSEIEYVWGVKK